MKAIETQIMERKLCMRSVCASHITALAYQPIRREIIAGFEGNQAAILQSYFASSSIIKHVANNSCNLQ